MMMYNGRRFLLPVHTILVYLPVPEDGSCETGWLQFRQDKCYRFVHIRLGFDDSESLCNNLYGGHLPSIHSQEEQFMITQFLASVNVKNGSEIWLGARQMDFHNFNWGDGTPFNYSYWERGEPNFPSEKCIEMSWRNGRWNDINCRLKRAVLCERQVTSRHYGKPNLYQSTTCLESNCTSSNASTGVMQVNNGSGLSNLVSFAASSGNIVISNTSSVRLQSSEVESPTTIIATTSSQIGSGAEISTSPDSSLPQNSSSIINPMTGATADWASSNGYINHSNKSATGKLQPTSRPATFIVDGESNLKIGPSLDERPLEVVNSILSRPSSTSDRDDGYLPRPTKDLPLASEQHMLDSTPSQAHNHHQWNFNESSTLATAIESYQIRNDSFIHYNLPPPDSVSDLVVITNPGDHKKHSQTSPDISESHSMDRSNPSNDRLMIKSDSKQIISKQAANPISVVQNPTSSLMDKIKSASFAPSSSTSGNVTIQDNTTALPLKFDNSGLEQRSDRLEHTGMATTPMITTNQNRSQTNDTEAVSTTTKALESQ